MRAAFFFLAGSAHGALQREMANPIAEQALGGHVEPPADRSFFDNTLGYCEQSEQSNVVAVALLMETAEGDLMAVAFDEEGEPLPQFEPFIELVKDFINDDFLEEILFTDEDILHVMTRKVELARDRLISRQCNQRIVEAIVTTTRAWFMLMGIGDFPGSGSGLDAFSNKTGVDLEASVAELREISADVALQDELMNPIVGNFPKFLEIYEANASSFSKFADSMIFKYRVIDAEKAMDVELIGTMARDANWFEAAATGQSFPAKYAAFALTRGHDLEFVYDEMNLDEFFSPFYANVVEICSLLPPTSAPLAFPSSNSPTLAPTMTPAILDEIVTMIAVVATGGPSSTALSDSFESFREVWPDRPICVLEVRVGGEDIMAPRNLVLDPLVTYRFANRDYGESFYRSDWFDLCGLQNLPLHAPESDGSEGVRGRDGAIPDVALLIGNTVTVDVDASGMFFMQRLESAGLRNQIIMPRLDNNWVEPFDISFTMPANQPIPQPSTPPSSGGAASAPTARPSAQVTSNPIGNPVARPTTLPNISPSAPPSDPAGSFAIELDFVGATSSDQDVINRARARMETIIVGDVPDARLEAPPATPCGTGRQDIDDFYCCIRFRNLPSNILGVGGVRLVRTDIPGKLLPLTGEISIDRSSHAGQPQMLRDTVEHELLHALGFGILFDVSPYSLASAGGGSCSYNAQTEVSRRFKRISGCPSGTSIPMTDTCGHWSHACFSTNELMGPYGGGSLSELTIAGLQDLGYDVDYSKADSLTGNDLTPLCRCGGRYLRHQSIHDSPPAKRRLDGNEALAVQYGLALLEARAMENDQLLLETHKYMDLGQQVVSILFLDEEGNKQGVVVHNSMQR